MSMAVCAAAPAGGSRLWIQWTLSDRGRLTVISFAGEIDRTNAAHLLSTLVAVLEAGTARVVLDLSGVTFLGVAGGRALAAARAQAAARHVPLDVCASDPVRATLEHLGTHDTFGLHRTVNEALSPRGEAAAGAACT